MYRYHDQIQLCRDCAVACATLLTALTRSAVAGPRLLWLLVDAEQACNLAASLMGRQSEFLQQSCGICADICQTCANACAEQSGEQLDEVARLCQEAAGALHMVAQRVPRLGSRASASVHERYAG